jgi:hypothetical protein
VAEGIKGYSAPSALGGVDVDVESMMVDLVMVFKAGGYDKDTFMAFASTVFDNVEVNVIIPDKLKQ